MNMLSKAAGFTGWLKGKADAVGRQFNSAAKGLGIKTVDIPISPTVVDEFTLADVNSWMRENMHCDEPCKLAVVREEYDSQLTRISLVVLNRKNRRAANEDGGLRAKGLLARSLGPKLLELFGSHITLLLGHK